MFVSRNGGEAQASASSTVVADANTATLATAQNISPSTSASPIVTVSAPGSPPNESNPYSSAKSNHVTSSNQVSTSVTPRTNTHQGLRHCQQHGAASSHPSHPSTQLPPHRRLGRIARSLSSKVDGGAMIGSLLRTAMAGISLKRVFYTILVIGFVVVGLVAINVEQLLKSFLLWLKNDVGVWGPVIMALAYIPLNILALPGAILTLGGGYVFGLLVGFVADSLGSTAGATAAFLVGKTIGRSYVSAKLKEYPQFQPVAHAISKSGFKIVLLLRLVPILPFNVMNYVLSVTPISLSSYVLASWIGMMPITFTFVYLGTTIKDISEIGSPGAAGASQWWMLGAGLAVTILATVLITRIAKDALQRAIEENQQQHCGMLSPPASCSSTPTPLTPHTNNTYHVPSPPSMEACSSSSSSCSSNSAVSGNSSSTSTSGSSSSSGSGSGRMGSESRSAVLTIPDGIHPPMGSFLPTHTSSSHYAPDAASFPFQKAPDQPPEHAPDRAPGCMDHTGLAVCSITVDDANKHWEGGANRLRLEGGKRQSMLPSSYAA
ncbi:unnamed protein product [Closterium sp. NIES-54]